jgi:hypothetical protein
MHLHSCVLKRTIDREGPAARGNREYERLMQMSTSSRTSAYTATQSPAMSALPSEGKSWRITCFGTPLFISLIIFLDYSQGATFYDPRRNNIPFTHGSPYTAFAHQYAANGPTLGGWSPAAVSMNNQYSYPYPDTRNAANYSVAAAGSVSQGGLNQQAAAFTPRGAINPNQYNVGIPGYSVNGNADPNMLTERFQRFAINARQS